MNKLEQLEQEAFEDDIRIHDYYLGEETLKGFYIDGNIAINTSVSSETEKACIIAEELGHHHTSVGDIINMSDSQNRKQERQARLWGYNKLIGLNGDYKSVSSRTSFQTRCSRVSGSNRRISTRMY